MSSNVDQNLRPDYDPEIQAIVDYVLDYRIDSRGRVICARSDCGRLITKDP